MDTNRKIVKALLMKDYAALKEGVFSALYTKASLALNEARHGVAEAVFNAAKQLDEVSPPDMEKMTGSKSEQARAAAKKKDKALKKWFETRKSKKTP